MEIIHSRDLSGMSLKDARELLVDMLRSHPDNWMVVAWSSETGDYHRSVEDMSTHMDAEPVRDWICALGDRVISLEEY